MANKYDTILDKYRQDDNILSDNTLLVKAGSKTTVGRYYPTVATAIAYINTQTPAVDNRWTIIVLDAVNTESFTCPDWTLITSPKAFGGAVFTVLSGDISLGGFSTMSNINCTGQITFASTVAETPSIIFGCYFTGTVISGAGTYGQFVTTFLAPSDNIDVNGQITITTTEVSQNQFRVNAGGILTGDLMNLAGISVVADNGGTISLNSTGLVYDNTDSGLTADTVGDAIDEVETRVQTNEGNISTNTSDISTNASNIATNTADISTNADNISTNAGNISTNASNISTNASDISDLDTNKADKSNVLELDNTDAFTPDADYEPATKKYVDDSVYTSADFDTDFATKDTDDLTQGSVNEYWAGHDTDDLTEGTTNTYSLWEVDATSGETELKSANDINLDSDYKIFYQ